MKRTLTIFSIIGIFSNAVAQEPILTEWMMNTDGTMASFYENTGNIQNPNFQFFTTNDSANILQRCYDNDWVYVRAEGMTTDMGQFLNPGVPTAQDYTYKFPRYPAPATTNEDAPIVNSIGMLINGVPIYGKGDARSWDLNQQANTPMGQGIWNGEAFVTEGITLDTAFAAHPQQQGAYHSHATPHRLYNDPSSSHSPIVGFAHDGYPVYGPFGYVDPNDANSGVMRISSSYQLRNITQRHTLPDGITLSANEYGPDVTGQHPLGEYIEDYEYVQGLGDLDEHNGRNCVTPEYPGGTYAYFVTTDGNGDPVYPYYIGGTYYGTPVLDNSSPMSTVTIPSSGVTCEVNVGVEELAQNYFGTYPNPAANTVRLDFDSNQLPETITIADQVGRVVHAIGNVMPNTTIDVANWTNGLYFCTATWGNNTTTVKLLVAHP